MSNGYAVVNLESTSEATKLSKAVEKMDRNLSHSKALDSTNAKERRDFPCAFFSTNGD